jgi:nucleoside-diphosphate-sugar epimerase
MTGMVKFHGVTQIYHLAALLSATGEKDPQAAWRLNMDSLLNVLETARTEKLDKVFFPSSIAVFGPNAQKKVPQHTVTQPATVYGISKTAGELWCSYYAEQYGLDVRGIRFPGLISYTAKPGGGTTDYAVDIFHQALQQRSYTCFLSEQTRLPMLYMPDAVRAVIELMEADPENVRVRTAYNLGGLSFTPRELAAEIHKHIPDFDMNYRPDFRQAIADSWPAAVEGLQALYDWGWKPAWSLEAMVSDMLQHVQKNG